MVIFSVVVFIVETTNSCSSLISLHIFLACKGFLNRRKVAMVYCSINQFLDLKTDISDNEQVMYIAMVNSFTLCTLVWR